MDKNFNPFTLGGKSVLVTGASSGIGKGVAVLCSKMGAKVILTGRNEEHLATVKTECVGEVSAISADLNSDDGISHLAENVPNLDGIVHCAGIGDRTLCKNIVRQDVERVMNTDFYAPVLLQSVLLKAKKINKNASIVFIASRAAECPSMGNALYSAAKGALISYSKVLGLELAPRGIRVNCISPAMVWTDLILTGGVDEATLREQEKTYPLKRYGNPEDVANLAVYLLSDASSWMTGSAINLTGGGEGTL